MRLQVTLEVGGPEAVLRLDAFVLLLLEADWVDVEQTLREGCADSLLQAA